MANTQTAGPTLQASGEQGWSRENASRSGNEEAQQVASKYQRANPTFRPIKVGRVKATNTTPRGFGW